MTVPAPNFVQVFTAPGLRITDAGNDGLIVAVDDGRDDEWPATRLDVENMILLRAWLDERIGRVQRKRGRYE